MKGPGLSLGVGHAESEVQLGTSAEASMVIRETSLIILSPRANGQLGSEYRYKVR